MLDLILDYGTLILDRMIPDFSQWSKEMLGRSTVLILLVISFAFDYIQNILEYYNDYLLLSNCYELGTFSVLSPLITLWLFPFYRKETESAEMTCTLSKVTWLTVGGVGIHTQLWLHTPFYKPLCYTVVVFGITYSCEIFITAVFGHSFVEIPNTIMVSSISLLKFTIQWYVQEKWLLLPSSWLLCLEPGSLLAGLAQWAVASSESLVHTVSWWRPEPGSVRSCFSRTAFRRDSGVLPLSQSRVSCVWNVLGWVLPVHTSELLSELRD